MKAGLMADQRSARLLFLGAVLVGYWLGSAIRVHAAESQPPASGGASISDLVGIWEQVEIASTDSCVMVSLTISVPGNAQNEPASFLADQGIQCDDDRGSKYIVHYDGQLLQNNAKYFISLNAKTSANNMNPVEPIGNADPGGYSPDRLTLWLSRNGCTLFGSVEDAKDPTGGFDLLTLKKRGCY